MSESESDRELFITQNTFCNNLSDDCDSDNAASAAFNLLNASFDNVIWSEINREEKDEHNDNNYPCFSDISDDELIKATQDAEISQNKALADHSTAPPIVIKPTSSRFKDPISDESAIALASKKFAAKTTSKVKWAVQLFENWLGERNKKAIDHPYLNLSPIKVALQDMTVDELNYSLCRFISEVRKVNGDEYPGETLRSIVLMIQFHLQEKGKNYKLISDSHFDQIRNTLDNVMKVTTNKGIVTPNKKADIITLAEENILWEKGILGTNNPKNLLNAIFYSVGLNFALRGGEEHRSLRHGDNSQIKLVTLSPGNNVLRYCENTSKSYQGGLKDLNKKKKSVDVYPNYSNVERCPVDIYQLYLSHCPKPLDELPSFYLRPLSKPNGDIWYSRQAVGRLKNICDEAKLGGYRTNYSLRSTAATCLFDANVDEQLITEVPGHRSEAVRNYKRVNESKRRCISSIVQGISSDTTCVNMVEKNVSQNTCYNPPVALTINVNLK